MFVKVLHIQKINKVQATRMLWSQLRRLLRRISTENDNEHMNKRLVETRLNVEIGIATK